MNPATEHAIARLRRGPGKLAFEAQIGGSAHEVWFRTETAVVPPADAALAACLMPAMRSGGSLALGDPLSPRLLRTQREFQAIQRAWSADWHCGHGPLEEVEVSAPTRAVEPRPPTGRVAAFFSRGGDCSATVLGNPELTDLIFVPGFDLRPGAAEHEAPSKEVEVPIHDAASKLGLTLHLVETNLRAFSDPLIHWEAGCVGALAAVALLFEPLFDRVLIAGVNEYAHQPGIGASRLVSRLWSTELLEIAEDGGRRSRAERSAEIAAQEIADLRLTPGELSFEARIGGRSQRVWIRSDTAVTPPADVALALGLMPAMRSGGSLTMSDPVSPRVLRNQREFEAIQRAWSEHWDFDEPPLRELAVSAPTRAIEPRPPTGRVAAFFSGGVDSWATVLDNPELTDLIFVRGVDLLPGAAHQAELVDEVEARTREVAASLGLTLHVAETNVRELSDPLLPWEAYSTSPLAAVALFFETLFDRVLIASDSDYATQLPISSAWTVDGLWSSERVEIADDGGRLNREQRLRLVIEHPEARRTLRVCWENRGGAYNCGRCGKCMLTKISLEALGQRERVTSLPPGLDLELLEGFEMGQKIQLILWEDVLTTTRAAGRDDLTAAVEAHVERGRRALGMAPSFRSRRRPALLTPPATAAPIPTLFAPPETAAALAVARSVALLIGGYDGSGNFGDVAQLDAALGLLDQFAPDLLALPLIERWHEADHRDAAAGMKHPPEHVLYFDAAGRGGADLVAVRAPAELAYAACYLYGGGYLNPLWGEHRLAMLAAAEALVMTAAQRVTRVASGLQVDPGWLAGLAPSDRRRLRSFELLGGRDGVSAAALGELGPGTIALESGDDALGLLSELPAAEPAASGPLRVNVHVATHEWVTANPDAVLELFAGTLAFLAQRSGRPLAAQPLLAYLDSRTDDRASLERLRGACAERGIELGEAQLLRPAELSATATTLARADLTLSCSYHAALTALMAGVPALLLRDTPYYAQKASGLAEDFSLPSCFSPRSSADPETLAGELLAAISDEAGAELRREIELAVALLARRRRETEATIVARLAAGAFGVVGSGAGSPAGAALLAAEARAAVAEQRDAAAHAQLATVFASRSWRAAEPLRRAGRALRAWRARG